jgi:hypothetical protein
MKKRAGYEMSGVVGPAGLAVALAKEGHVPHGWEALPDKVVFTMRPPRSLRAW